MFCKDDSLDYLNHLGYNVVKLPREKIEPLLVIAGKKQGLEVLGPLSHFVVDASSIPPVKCNEETAEISSMKTNKLDSNLGIDLMNTLLSAMGAAGGKVNLGYQKAGQIEITFDNVLSDYVYPTEIDDYLLSGKPKAKSLLKEWIDKENEAYVITRTIKSNSFGVIAYDKSGHFLEVDIKGIQDLLGVSGKIIPSRESTNKVVYQGEKLLVFGFQSISFSIEGKDKEEPKFKLTPAKKTVVLKGKEDGESDQARNVLFARHELLEMNFQD